MSYEQLVTAALAEMNPETELLEFCVQNSIPSEQEWSAFHAYAARIKLQLLFAKGN